MANRDFAEVESAWREYAGLHPEDHEYLTSITSQMARTDKSALAGELTMALAQMLLDKDDADAAFEVARASLKASQRTEGLSELLVSVYQAKHEDNDHLADFVDKAGLLSDGGGSLRAQIDALDRYLTFSEGAYVYHRGGWGYGEVVEFRSEDERMTVDFQRRRGHGISLLNATKILERLPREHIGVYKHFRRDELLEIIETDPAQVFHIFLASHGGKATLKQVREELAPDVIDKPKWTRWWGKAKKALLKDPKIRMGKGSSPLLELRSEAKSIETEVAEKMRAHTDPIDRCRVAREYLRTLDLTPELAEAVGNEVNAALAAPAAEVEGEEGEAEALSPSAKLALLYLSADLKGENAAEAKEGARQILAETTDLAELLEPLEVADRKHALQDLAAGAADGWAEQIVDLLRSGDAEIADTALECLRRSRPDILISFFAEMSSRPSANPDVFLWYARGFIQGSIPLELAPGELPTTVMEKLLTLANQVGLEQKRTGDAELKEFLRHVRAFLTARRLKTFTDFVSDASIDYARFLFAKIQRNRGITDQTKTALLDILESEHAQLHTDSTAEDSDAQEISDDVIWTTLAGYRRKEAELRTLVEEEIPDNATDLGRAASFGDISENAEYSAALEKQEQLMRRLRDLREALDRAQILDPESVTTDRVVVGTRVRLTNQSRSREETYSILGPWDVDLDHGIISYLSPVGRGLLGQSKGSRTTIQLPEEGSVEYEVLAIEPDPTLMEEATPE